MQPGVVKTIVSAILLYMSKEGISVLGLSKLTGISTTGLESLFLEQKRLSTGRLQRIVDALEVDFVVRLHPRQEKRDSEFEKEEERAVETELAKVVARVEKQGEIGEVLSENGTAAAVGTTKKIKAQNVGKWLDELEENEEELNQYEKWFLVDCRKWHANGSLGTKETERLRLLWERKG